MSKTAIATPSLDESITEIGHLSRGGALSISMSGNDSGFRTIKRFALSKIKQFDTGSFVDVSTSQALAVLYRVHALALGGMHLADELEGDPLHRSRLRTMFDIVDLTDDFLSKS